MEISRKGERRKKKRMMNFKDVVKEVILKGTILGIIYYMISMILGINSNAESFNAYIVGICVGYLLVKIFRL